MAVPVYSASPINQNALNSAFATSPSTFAMRYTPAEALDGQLAAAAANTLPSSANSSRPSSPCSRQAVNTLSHATNATTTTTTSFPARAQPTMPTRSQSVSYPPLSKLSIPSTPPAPFNTTHAQPAILSTYAPSPLTNSTYGHSRAHSSFSQLSSASHFSAASPHPFLFPHDLSHPPGYVQNTRDSFEDRVIISQDPEEQSFLVSPRGRRRGGSTFRGGLLDEPMDPLSARGEEEEGEFGRLWETAGEWARFAAKKLGEGERDLWRVVSGER